MAFPPRNHRFYTIALLSLISTLLWCLPYLAANEALATLRDSVRFNCTTDPRSSVDWQYQKTGESSRVDIFIGNAKGGGGQKGNRYISETRYRIHMDIPSGRYDLLIDNVTQADQGLYSCSDVSNPESTTTTKLTVLGTEEERFCSNDVAAAVGDVVNLTFPTAKKDSIQLEHRSMDRSYPVHVFRDGRLVNDYYVLSGRFSFSASKSSWNLVIKNVQTSDAGSFICSEDNGLGEQYTRELVVVDATGVVCSTDAEKCYEELNVTCSANYYGHYPPHLQLTLEGNNRPRDEIRFTTVNKVSLQAVVNWTNAPLCRIEAQLYTINSACRSPDSNICHEASIVLASNTTTNSVGTAVGITLFLIIAVIGIIAIVSCRQNIRKCWNGRSKRNNARDCTGQHTAAVPLKLESLESEVKVLSELLPEERVHGAE